MIVKMGTINATAYPNPLSMCVGAVRTVANDWLIVVKDDDDWYGWLLLIVGTSVGSDGWYGEFII